MEETNTTASKNKQMNPLIIIVIILAIAVVGFAAYKSNNSQKSTETSSTDSDMQMQPSEQAPSVTIATESAHSDSEVKTINIEAGSFYYKPNEIKVKKGDTVKIVMTSKDMMHNFNIDELNVHLPMTQSGETNSVEFVADKAGTFEYYCSVGQHRKLGQKGNLIVE
jgi:heme/copper-type cytochrome/quinol oxidase subunit 2